MKPGEEHDVVNLVLDVFSEFVAPQFSSEGVAEFKKFVNESAMAARYASGNPIIVAQAEAGIAGVIEIRENSHIALLFVRKSCQQRGIAKKLIHEAIGVCRKRNRNIQKITVNSSPNAYDAYRHLGFKGDRIEKITNGIRFVPMELALENGA